MPKVNHVKRAQQRYAMVPVIDETTGEQKRVPMINSRTGEQKTSKTGRPVFIGLTVRDYGKPLPMPTCDHCREVIAVGAAYKWIEPSGQRVRNRHESCPTWNVWEYSSSLSARIAQIVDGNTLGDFETLEEVQSFLADQAQAIRDLADEKRESADNIESGFGHETAQSQELADIADQLEQWADDVESVDLPEEPEAEETDCDDCDGTGVNEEETECVECDGSGRVTPDEPTEEQMQEWRDEVESAVADAMGNCPV